MAKFEPVKLNDEINLATEHPLFEMGKYFLGFIVCAGLIFLLIGFSLELMIKRLPIETENKIWEKIAFNKMGEQTEELERQAKYVNRIFNKIPTKYTNDGYSYEVIVTDEDQPNAFAVPGGRIIITNGLLENLESENALLFVLGHELGHFKNRDHLKGIGFNVAALVISMAVMGQSSDITSFISGFIDLSDLAHSRKRETLADEKALIILNDVYGHAGGADEFFNTLSELNKDKITSKIPSIMSTHPSDEDRIQDLKDNIDASGFLIKKTKPIKKF